MNEQLNSRGPSAGRRPTTAPLPGHAHGVAGSLLVSPPGRYRLLDRAEQQPGRISHRALDLEVEVEVELWWLAPELVRTDTARQRMLAGARAWRKLGDKRHVRRVFDLGSGRGIGPGDEPSAMYVALQRATRCPAAPETRLEGQALLRYARSVCAALHAAHQAGVIHGYLSPADITEVGDEIKVAGFGVWAGAVPESVVRAWGREARFLAPEALVGAAEPAADVFAAAAILGELACDAAMWRHSGDAKALELDLARQCPALAGVLGRALSARPERRPQSASELLAEIEAALEGHAKRGAARRSLPLAANSTADGEVNEASEGPPPAAVTQRGQPTDESVVELGDAGESALSSPPAALRGAGNSRLAEGSARRRLPLAADPSEGAVEGVDEIAVKPRIDAVADPGLDVAPTVPFVASEAPGLRRRLRWPLVGLAAVALAALVVVVLTVVPGGDRGSAAQSVAPPAAPSDVQPVRPPAVRRAPIGRSAACAAGMIAVEGESRFCMDRYESPGPGRMPEAGIRYSEAQAACQERGARLCQPDEWERACRGDRGWSFPYGQAYRGHRCNTAIDHVGQIGPAGAAEGCVSRDGIHDLSGNVAEWVAGERVRGGSATDQTDGRCSRQRRPSAGRSFSDVGYRCCADPAEP